MQRITRLFPVLLGLLFGLAPGMARAHFGMLIPSDCMVMQDDPREVVLQASFIHPREMSGMDLARPKSLTVVRGDWQADLLPYLQPVSLLGHGAWQVRVPLRRPGVYIFTMEPQPYWEQAEDLFIIHYTKTIVAAFGDEEGWDRELGLKTEIVPLTRPFGLYSGNVFQGIVKLDGNPVPYAEVEVEWFDRGREAPPANSYLVTQVVRADGNGVFTYAAPRPGWWGFAALNEADFRLKNASGEEKAVELGAVLWVHFEQWP